MEIKELYQLYQQHPCITTDSRAASRPTVVTVLKGVSSWL